MKATISALVDGELEALEAGSALAAVLQGDEQAREAWRMYHLINDAMSNSRLLSAGFAERFARGLDAEPTVIAPGAVPAVPARWSARRYLYPAVASAAAVGFVWLMGFPQPERARPVSQVAVAPAGPAKVESPVNRIPPPKAAEEYLLAHHGFSPRNALQGLAPYVRTVADEGSGRPRQ